MKLNVGDVVSILYCIGSSGEPYYRAKQAEVIEVHKGMFWFRVTEDGEYLKAGMVDSEGYNARTVTILKRRPQLWGTWRQVTFKEVDLQADLLNKEEHMREFKVGDRVTAFGNKGTVERLRTSDEVYPVVVKLDTGQVADFTADGKATNWHAKPSLKHLKKKPRLECYVNVFKDGDIYSHKTRADAELNANPKGFYSEIGVRMVRAKDQKRGEK